ncbi:hypothetical protein C8Q77DRAFT_129270 [Trametes polyzona]|nr:hypothetical protein C8Q77DRAFT_129270 [Trametes polyzona]
MDKHDPRTPASRSPPPHNPAHTPTSPGHLPPSQSVLQHRCCGRRKSQPRPRGAHWSSRYLRPAHRPSVRKSSSGARMSAGSSKRPFARNCGRGPRPPCEIRPLTLKIGNTHVENVFFGLAETFHARTTTSRGLRACLKNRLKVAFHGRN